VYIDYAVDESYSPKKIVIRAGSFYHDLKVPVKRVHDACGQRQSVFLLITLRRAGGEQDVAQIELEEPKGWVVIPLVEGGGQGCIRANVIQIVIPANHQNGRDTHLRQVAIYGPVQCVQQPAQAILHT
jgi:anaphase-promoting complex subunit 10